MGSIGMDWNQKGPFWDWENMPILGSNPNENPKNVVQAEPKSAGAVADIGHESGHSPGSTFSSSSEIGCGSSKSSISASIGSSTILGDNMELNIASANEPGRSMCKNSELCKVDDTETSQLSVEAASHGEPLIGLKLGKRTYFEDACGGQSVKSSPMDTSVATSSPSPTKKAKGDQNALKFYCQVEGCKIDLFSAKSYHQKHRVCEAHSKAPKVVVAGLERRFCQQCSRFHALTEFDQKKRSCRRRLNDHNFRRRKPKQEAVPFGPLRLSTIFFDARQQRTDTRQRATDARQRTTDVRQQISLLFGQAPYGEITSGASSVQDSPGPGGFEFTETKAPWLKPTRAGGVDEMHISSQQLPNNILRHGAHCSFDGLVAFKETNSKALDQGMEASAVASDSAGGPDFQRALSLLSINSEGDADVIIQPGSQMHSGFTAIAGASNHVMTSSAALWQGSLSLDQQQQQFQSFDRLGNGSATPHYLRLQLPKPSYGNSHYDQMQ